MKGRIGNSLIERHAFSIIEPEFVELSVRAEIYADGFEDVFRIKKQVTDRLAEFLDPVSGNFNGNCPFPLVLPSTLERIDDDCFVSTLYEGELTIPEK